MCGCRKTAIIGGVLIALGWILSAYASNVHYLFLTFGVTAGKSIAINFATFFTVKSTERSNILLFLLEFDL